MPKNKSLENIFKGMGISKVQAEALAVGFLDSIGTDDKITLRPKETFSEIILLAGEFIEDSQTNLINSKSISSGELSKSLIAHEPVKSGDTLSIDIEMLFYGKFINSGVKGTKSGMSNAGYSFKNDMPSRKMVSAFEKYIKRSARATRTVKKYSAISGHEVKQRQISAVQSAFAFARFIKMAGIKPTGFIDKAVQSTSNKVQDRLGAAFRIDILNSI